MPDERHSGGDGDAFRHQEGGAERVAAGAAEVPEAEHGRQQRHAEEHDAAYVEVRIAALRDVRDYHRAEGEQHEAYRDVDQEDAAPGPVRDDDPAEYGPDDAAHREDAGKQPEGAIPARAELVSDDPGGGRHERAAAERLDRAEHDEQVDVVGQA